MTPVRLDQVAKHFGPTIALDATSLTIAAGDLFFLLGPSGCGKSTLLRLIAGLHEPTSGRIFFGETDVTRLGTEKRNAVMCFQSYALWPHMSVADNVKFGLDVKGLSRADTKRRVDEVLALVRMTEYADRKPNQLSGGQQQRVALARAIAVEPDVLLLDEPLSNLDAKLRHEMRSEIRRICKESGVTAVYVTHDQKEALSVADSIAVLRDGRVQQVGAPGELYHSPTTAFVADFVGHTNLLDGTTTDGTGVDTSLGHIRGRFVGEGVNGTATVSVRPEQIRLLTDGESAANSFDATIADVTFLGEASEFAVHAGGDTKRTPVRVIVAPPRFDLKPGDDVRLGFADADAVILPPR
jgi:iron(III) transport system ATP-binding protein